MSTSALLCAALLAVAAAQPSVDNAPTLVRLHFEPGQALHTMGVLRTVLTDTTFDSHRDLQWMTDTFAYVTVPSLSVLALREHGLQVEENVPDQGQAAWEEFQQQQQDAAVQPRDLEDWGRYHTHEEMTAILQQLANSNCSDVMELHSVGKSHNGRDLWVLEITKNPGVQTAAKSNVLFTGNIHGDEVIGRELLLRWTTDLCSAYKKGDARVTNLLSSVHLWVWIALNPDGYANRRRGNARGADLNRAFPDQWRDPADSPAGRQPEAVAYMKFTETHDFVISSTYHGGALCANYAFDCGQTGRTGVPAPTPHDPEYVMMSKVYSFAHKTMHKSRTFKDGIVQGSMWYCLHGGLQDYSYVYRGSTIEITMEVGPKFPSGSSLPGYYDENVEAFYQYAEKGNSGVRGTVTDCEGQPIAAVVTAEGRIFKQKTSHVAERAGVYHVILVPGTYDLTFSSEAGEATAQVVIPEQQNRPVGLDIVVCDRQL